MANLNPPFKSYKGKEPYLFISYSHNDKPSVYSYISAIKMNGYRIWYDEGIEPGSMWNDEIASAIENCTQFLIFMGPNTFPSDYIKREINHALNNDKKILPIIFNSFPIPNDISFLLGPVQNIVNENMQEAFFIQKILNSIDKKCLESYYSKESIKVSISFANLDVEIASKIITGLAEKKIHIFYDYKIASLNSLNKNYIHSVEDKIPPDIDYCIILITRNYFETKWNKVVKCPLLSQAITMHKSLFPVKIGKSIPNIKGVTSFIKSLEINPEEYQLVINKFIEKINETIEIKEYQDIQTILHIHNPKAKINLISKNIIKKIGYELYRISDSLIQKTIYNVLYLYKGVTIEATFEFIKEHHPHLLSSGELIVLLPKEKGQTKLELRKNNIKSTFKAQSVFYIDEFIWNQCTNDEFKEDIPKYSEKYFVEPYLDGINGSSIEIFTEWLNSVDNPLLILTGSGGIGKTTFAKKIADLYYDIKPNSKVLFIESNNIAPLLKNKQEYIDELDLYAFYEADNEHHRSNGKLNKDIFRINIDNGNIFIVIDGLDEIISQVPKFNIDDFITSIYKYIKDVGIGKVLITCRNYFWQKANPQINYESFELLPFDEELALKYLNNYFPSWEAKVKKGILIAKSLVGNEIKNEFIPFVLDLVVYILKEDSSAETFDASFVSSILKKNINIDYIIYKICFREKYRTEQKLDVDQQVSFFMQMAINSKSILNQGNFNNFYQNTDILDIENHSIEALKAHPLLIVSEETGIVSFKYDFLIAYFKILYLEQFFSIQKKLSLNALEIISDNIDFNSYILNEFSKRFGKLDENKKIYLIQSIEEISLMFNLGQINEKSMKKAISGIFFIALKSNIIDGLPTMELNTEIMKDLFLSSKNTIQNLFIINLMTTQGPKITFDFSDLIFNNCYISKYDRFWECRFNEKTLFTKSKFKHLDKKDRINTTATNKNFNLSTCEFDETVKTVLNDKEINIKNGYYKVNNDLFSLLKTFYKNGTFINIPLEKIKRTYRGKYGFDEMLEIVDGTLIEKYVHTKVDYVKINDNYRSEISKFILEGQMSSVIKDILTKLYKP